MKSFHGIILCILVLMLAGCQAASYSYWITKKGDILYTDDFSNLEGGWPIYTTGEAASALTDEKYTLWITVPTFSSWALSGKVYQDIQVEVDASRLGGPLSNMFGLTCRADQEGNFYFFIISSDGYYAIGKMQAGGFSLLGQDMMAFSSAIILDEGTNHLRFDCIDSSLTGYVNGQMVAITGDSTFPSGDTGVIAGSFDAGGVVVSFDNFTLYKP